MAKVIKKISDVIFAILIVALALYFILRFDNRIRIYSVMTGSMEDKIYAGDYILILKQDDYKVGDIVTFGKDGYYITHRIIKIEGNRVTTKGDANNVEDATIDRARIIGKVIMIGGALNFIIKYKFGFVGILLALYLISYYFDGKESKKEKVEETNSETELLIEGSNTETVVKDLFVKEKTEEQMEEKEEPLEEKVVEFEKTEEVIEETKKEVKANVQKKKTSSGEKKKTSKNKKSATKKTSGTKKNSSTKTESSKKSSGARKSSGTKKGSEKTNKTKKSLNKAKTK